MNFLLIYTNQFQLMRDPGIKNFRARYNLFLAKELTLFLFHVPIGLNVDWEVISWKWIQVKLQWLMVGTINHAHKTLRRFDGWANFPFTTSETKCQTSCRTTYKISGKSQNFIELLPKLTPAPKMKIFSVLTKGF